MTTVLVTHFMDEAEYLCDRVAVLTEGRVAALDTPRALAASLGGTRVRFRAEGVDTGPLRALPGVTEVTAEGGPASVVVTGDSTDLAFTVSAELGRQGVVPDGFDVRAGGLEDVMLALRQAPPRHHSEEEQS
ncbi:hypothetical protein ABZ635_18355 [Nocardiopsis sp. NPDC007018]|uniref:hypothetical protein n=1 Tax=Nocardiopsis sp. NPDC007018 TaxID=3155721 RepID=UPI0033D6EC94